MSANLEANVHATGQHKAVALFQHLKPLLADYDAPCLSLYQPTFRAFPDIQQNPVRYKNLLRELKKAVAQKYASADASSLLQPMELLLDNEEFWAHPQDGITVFSAKGFFHVEKVQRPVPELVVVNDHLHIRPLVRVFQSDDTYQVLSVDRGRVRLYQGNRYVVDEIVMAPSVPRTIEDALGDYVPLQGTQKKGDSGPGRPGHAGTGAFHGHGSKMDEPRNDVERFFRVVDRAILEAHSKPSELPLILATLSEYQTRFREISKNPFLLDTGIDCDADALSLEELRDRAWRVVEPRYHARLRQMLDEYGAATARGLGSDDLTHVVEFAADGRVGTLIIEADRRIAGHIEDRRPRRDPERPGVGDILDDLAEQVLRTGGQVIVAPKGSMPNDKGLAAIFRY